MSFDFSIETMSQRLLAAYYPYLSPLRNRFLSGMVLLFGIGTLMAHAMYKEFIDPNIIFAHFLCCRRGSRHLR